MVDSFVKKKAALVPLEHKEEMQQEAFIRILKSYEKIDATRGWKSFVFNHCRGAVMDYQKAGEGFAEKRWSLNKKAAKKNNNFKLNSRMDFSREDQNITLDSVMMNVGLFSAIEEDSIKIKWDLLACMAAQDENLHVFAKYLRGFEIAELSEFFFLSRGRICQIIEMVIERFDEPSLVDDVWFLQTCYAFGICRRFGLKDIDQSAVMNCNIGWTKSPVDLDCKTAIRLPNYEQLDLLGGL